MAIRYLKRTARFDDIVSVEEAEGLLAWLQKGAQHKLDLKACTHLHTANLQVIMAANPKILHWPEDPDLHQWLESALKK